LLMEKRIFKIQVGTLPDGDERVKEMINAIMENFKTAPVDDATIMSYFENKINISMQRGDWTAAARTLQQLIKLRHIKMFKDHCA